MNFERRLLEVIREARWFSRMGVDIPEAARLLLPQEEKFRDYHDRLTHLLLVRVSNIGTSDAQVWANHFMSGLMVCTSLFDC